MWNDLQVRLVLHGISLFYYMVQTTTGKIAFDLSQSCNVCCKIKIDLARKKFQTISQLSFV